jgi:5-enolpyruvylshikimate-3-phosphate synthase
MAASSTVTGAGVATATTSQISADKREACQRGNLQPEGVPRTEVADHAKGQQKDSAGNRSQRDQAYVNDAIHALAAAAAFAGGEVAFVVAAHLRRQAGNVVAPARQNLAHDWIDALLTHRL